MFDSLKARVADALDWGWDAYQPMVDDLLAREITLDTTAEWLRDASALTHLLSEVYSRLDVARTQNTADEAAQARYMRYIEHVAEPAKAAQEKLNRRLLDDITPTPEGFTVALRGIRADVDLFREANLPLQTEETRFSTEYDRIVGAQTVLWDGTERTREEMTMLLEEPDRPTRERAWRATIARTLEDRAALNTLWTQMTQLRRRIAANAGFDDYRTYAWQRLHRFDYTPDDSLRFHDAIEEVVVPAFARLMNRRAAALGVPSVRPWDVAVDVQGRAPLRPFSTVAELEDGGDRIFSQLDPDLGAYFATMREEGLLDLENRKNKAPGAYCTGYDVTGRPFIFQSAVGTHDNVQTLLHEAGHAFHAFEVYRALAYAPQQSVPMEFAEVASMSMELLAAPYLTAARGGFYAREEDANRARLEHLEGMIRFWPYMAVVDAFQHWAHTTPEGDDPAACDAAWARLWDRYMHPVDYTGLDIEKITGWYRKLHIYQVPFYYVEYGLAQLGAVQVWRNSLDDAPRALNQYRQALALGGTATLPDLFSRAGAKLAFDADTLRDAVELIEGQIDALAAQV